MGMKKIPARAIPVRPKRPPPDRPAIRLACETSDETDHYVAVLRVKPRAAAELLKLKELHDLARIQVQRAKFDVATSVVTSLFSLTFWSGFCVYVENLAGIGLSPGEWFDVSEIEDAAIGNVVSTSAETLRVKEDGIVFLAYHKHAGGQFETAEIGWKDLRQLARGRSPFPTPN